MTPAEALAAWESDDRLAGVIRACHPCYGTMDLTVAADKDADLLGMMTVCAIAARRSLSITACGTALDMLAACRTVTAVARSLGWRAVSELHDVSMRMRFVHPDVDEVTA